MRSPASNEVCKRGSRHQTTEASTTLSVLIYYVTQALVLPRAPPPGKQTVRMVHRFALFFLTMAALVCRSTFSGSIRAHHSSTLIFLRYTSVYIYIYAPPLHFPGLPDVTYRESKCSGLRDLVLSPTRLAVRVLLEPHQTQPGWRVADITV